MSEFPRTLRLKCSILGAAGLAELVLIDELTISLRMAGQVVRSWKVPFPELVDDLVTLVDIQVGARRIKDGEFSDLLSLVLEPRPLIDAIELRHYGLNIRLENFARINVFVGPNGSGKSRILRAISESPERNGFGGLSGQATLDVPDHPLSLNSALAALGQEEVTHEDILTGTSKSLRPTGEKAFYHGNFDLTEYRNESGGASYFSSGTLALANWSAFLRTAISFGQNAVLMLEEPESHLHPGAARVLLEQIVREVCRPQTYGLQLFISTHSTALVAACRRYPSTCRVYALNQSGELIDAWGRATDEARSGFSGDAILGAASAAVGASVHDLTPHRIVFAENSICSLLMGAAYKLKRPLNALLVRPPGGDAAAGKQLASFLDFVEGQVVDLHTKGPWNSHWNFVLTVVLDGPPGNSSEERKWSALKERGLEVAYVAKRP